MNNLQWQLAEAIKDNRVHIKRFERRSSSGNRYYVNYTINGNPFYSEGFVTLREAKHSIKLKK